MGKPDVRPVGLSAAETAAAIDLPHPFLDGIRRVFTVRCAIVLLLTIFVLISTVFWILPMTRSHSGFVPDDDAASAKIQASFILQKPILTLASHSRRLEYDIFEEIGVPNTKVSIISMHPTASKNSTYVIFGVLPESSLALISIAALSLLKSSLIELELRQINLTLTRSIFGETLFFEVLKFPGGITVIPLQTAFVWERTKSLFNFTVNNSVVHIQKNMKELKDQLKYGLNLRPYENVYVQMTNANGSTIAPPVTLQASILSEYGNGALLPNRLKQLAATITGFHVQNLGLNHSVFGEVKSVILSSYLNNSIFSFDSPSQSPSPSPSPYPSPSPSPSPSPFPSEGCPYHTDLLNPCSPSIVQDDLQPCSFCKKISPKLSHTSNHRIGSQTAYPSKSTALNPSLHQEYTPPQLTKQSAHAVFYDSNLLVQDKESIKASTSKEFNSLVSSSSATSIKAYLHNGAWLILTELTSAWILLSGLP